MLTVAAAYSRRRAPPAPATNPARGKIFTQNPNPNRLVRPPTANVPFLGGRPVPQPRRFYGSQRLQGGTLTPMRSM